MTCHVTIIDLMSASYNREAWFSKASQPVEENADDEKSSFEQQVHDMLAHGQLCSWVSVKGVRSS
jgi:hypothetical protein